MSNVTGKKYWKIINIMNASIHCQKLAQYCFKFVQICLSCQFNLHHSISGLKFRECLLWKTSYCMRSDRQMLIKHAVSYLHVCCAEINFPREHFWDEKSVDDFRKVNNRRGYRTWSIYSANDVTFIAFWQKARFPDDQKSGD